MGKRTGKSKGRDKRWERYRRRRDGESAEGQSQLDEKKDVDAFMKDRRMVVVSGDTAPHRHTLSSNGFRWDSSEKEWRRPAGRCTAATFSMLRSLSGIQVNEDIDLRDKVGSRRGRGRSIKNGGKVLIDAVTVSGDHAHLLKSDLREYCFRRDWGPRSQGWSTRSYWREAAGFKESTAEYFRSFGGVTVKFEERFVPMVAPLIAE